MEFGWAFEGIFAMRQLIPASSAVGLGEINSKNGRE
jgi:hypothetical protein